MKKLLFILLIFISSFGYSQTLKALLMGQYGISNPFYKSNGGIATSLTTSMSVSYPTSITGDILILHIAQKGNRVIYATGWTDLGLFASTISPYYSQKVLYKVSSGETGTQSVTLSAADTMAAIIYCYDADSKSVDVTDFDLVSYTSTSSISKSTSASSGGIALFATSIGSNTTVTPSGTDWTNDCNIASSSLGGWNFCLSSIISTTTQTATHSWTGDVRGGYFLDFKIQ